MEKLIEEKVETILRKHIITCDNCDKELMISVEYDDGYYNFPEDTVIEINLNGKQFRKIKTLCENCKKDYLARMHNEFVLLGFEEV